MMIGAIVIASITVVCIVLTSLLKPSISLKGHEIHLYWIISLLGAAAMLLAGIVSPVDLWNGFTADGNMNPFKILALFLSMTCLSVFLDELGFFGFLASYVLSKTKSNQTVVFVVLYALVSVLTMFTSNDIVILTLTPFIIFFAKRSSISPIPYLVAEFVGANTWSMMLIIGNPTNIYIASSFGVGFIDYLKVMAIPTLLAGLSELLILYILFHPQLKEPIEVVEHTKSTLDKPLVIFGLVVLSLTTIIMAISSYIPSMEMWIASICGFFVLLVGVLLVFLVRKEKPIVLGKTLKRAPYELIPFLLSMFTIALACEKCGITEAIAEAFNGGNAIVTYGTTSLLSANLLNNIPMSVFFTSVMGGLNGQQLQQAIYSTIIGSNIGAFITPLGALAGIMWMGILKNYGIKFTYWDFIKKCAVVGAVVAVVALASLALFI